MALGSSLPRILIKEFSNQKDREDSGCQLPGLPFVLCRLESWLSLLTATILAAMIVLKSNFHRFKPLHLYPY